MKGILKIYHPEETLKYNIKSTYCKAVYSNSQHLLELELITDDSVDHVDEDSLQNSFPQLALTVTDYPIEDGDLEGKNLKVDDSAEETYTEIDLYDDEDAYLYENDLAFDRNAEQELQLCWTGTMNDFYTGSDEVIPFKLKCHFRQDDIPVDEY